MAAGVAALAKHNSTRHHETRRVDIQCQRAIQIASGRGHLNSRVVRTN